MQGNPYREYRIKIYLNARHYIIINDQKGEIHPHTWEFSLRIRFMHSRFIEFRAFEKGITEYLTPYQNAVMNEMEPFDAIIPTIENMTDYFSRDFSSIIREVGGVLTEIEASETPTRSYILCLPEEERTMTANRKEQALSELIDSVLDDVLEIGN